MTSSLISTPFLGPAGLPGASGNSNPLGSITGNIGGVNTPISVPGSSLISGPPVPDLGGSFLGQGNNNSADQAVANESANAINSDINNLFGTGLSTNAPTNGTATTSSSTLSDLFLRSVIIILGFIFVAVGLSMFSSNKILTLVKGK